MSAAPTLTAKIFIDRFLGRLFCWLLAPLVRLLGLILRRDHSVSGENVRVLAVAKYFGLGSLTQALPMLKALKQSYPRAGLVLITRKANSEFTPFLAHLDAVLYVDDSGPLKLICSNLRLFWQLRAIRVDLFFDLELFSAYGALVSLFSLARNRYGFFCSKDTDFKSFIYTHLMYFNFQMPVRFCYLQLARMAGLREPAEAELPPLAIPASVEESARVIFRKLSKNQDDRVLGLNVNASDLSLARRWPLERFAQVAAHFAKSGFMVLLLGSPRERAYVEKIYDFIPGPYDRVINAAGLFKLGEMCATLKNLRCLLTNDTGIMNFAYAQGGRVVALFGPNTPLQYHVSAPGSVALHKDIYCSPCLYHLYAPPCHKLDCPPCMEQISAAEVIAALEACLGHFEQPQVVAARPLFYQGDYLCGELRRKGGQSRPESDHA